MTAAAAGHPQPDWENFRRLLRRRVRAYLAGKGTGADAAMWTKVALAFGGHALTLGAVLLHRGSAAGLIALYALFGAAQANLLINVGHDAAHSAITRSPRANRWLRLSLDLCGVDSGLFAMSHDRFHHACVNVYPHDEALRTRGMLRLAPGQQRRPWGRWQHWLVVPVYALASLDFLLARDWEMLAHDRRAWARLVAGKLLYLAATLALPMALTMQDPLVVLAGWIVAHLVLGLCVLTLFQITHLVEGSAFPAPGDMRATEPRQILATTKDMATDSLVLGAIAGGLHQHVAHHLYPRLAHTHYGAVTRIIAETAAECGVPYRRHDSFGAALRSHFGLLRSLGARDGLAR